MHASVLLPAELTVPWESNMEWACERKMARYADRKSPCKDRGWTCRVYSVEIGMPWFCSQVCHSGF